MAYETLLGLRYLRAKQRTSFISVITVLSVAGVTLGVATLVVVLAVMTGFQQQIVDKVINANAHAVLVRYGIDFSDYREVRHRILAQKGVRSVVPFILNEVMISSGNRIVGVAVKGINPRLQEGLESLRAARLAGKLEKLTPPQPGNLPGIGIGKELALKLNVQLGDVVTLVSPVSLFGLNYRQQAVSRTFRVRYLFRFGMYQYDSKFCYIALKQAQKSMKMGDSVTGLEINIDDPEKIGAIQKKIMHELGGWPYRLRDWRELNKNLFWALEQNKTALFVILIFIILVASFNIVGTLVLMVLEKAQEIAILRAMGATAREVMKIFMVYGLYIGALGTLGGVALGLLCAKIAEKYGFRLDPEIYFISKLPVLIDVYEIALVVISALVISFLATIYPSLQASRQQPVEILRYE